MSKIANAAKFIVRSRLARAPLFAMPEDICPGTLDEGYSVQKFKFSQFLSCLVVFSLGQPVRAEEKFTFKFFPNIQNVISE